VAPSSPEEPTASNSDEPAPEPAPKRAVRRRRRVTTKAVPGSDPTPQKEPPSHAENENDERLKRDTPPHWGYHF
jgi:hypothetical protein